MKRFSCECGNVLFFENSQCLQCGSEMGFDPTVGKGTELSVLVVANLVATLVRFVALRRVFSA